MGVWAAGGTVQHQNFKRQSLTGQVLPDFRNKASVGQIQKKDLPVQASCCTTSIWQVVYLLSSRLRGQQLYRGGRPHHTPGCICTKQQSETTPSCLQAWCLLLFLTNKCPLWCFPLAPRNRALLSALKACSGRHPFSMIFLMSSENLSAASWSVEAATSVISSFFKPNLFLT